jgi:hypothetical protein
VASPFFDGMKSSLQSLMTDSHLDRRITMRCLLAAAVMPIIFFGIQILAAPFYPRYSFSEQTISMLGTHFSRYPWIFNAGEMLTGFDAFAGAFGNSPQKLGAGGSQIPFHG